MKQGLDGSVTTPDGPGTFVYRANGRIPKLKSAGPVVNNEVVNETDERTYVKRTSWVDMWA